VPNDGMWPAARAAGLSLSWNPVGSSFAPGCGMRDRRIAIIGGGLAGLTAADALAASGARVTLFEREVRLGGRAATDDLDGYRIDVGAQLFSGDYARFLALVREIGLGGALVRVSGRDALFRGGRAHEVVYGSVGSMVASGGLSLGTKMRLGARYVPLLSRHADVLDLHEPHRAARAGLDGESIATWGAREIDSAFVESLVYPQLGAFYGALPEETSAGFYHILARMGLNLALFAVVGGAGRVAERLALRIEAAGGSLRLATPVTRVRAERGGASVTTDSGEEEFDAIVSAVPAPILLELLAPLDGVLRESLSAVRYRATLTLALLLDAPTDVRYFGLSFPRGESRYVAAVSVQENKGSELVPPGRGLLVAFAAPEKGPELASMESQSVLEAMLPEIARAFPGVERRVTRARVYRWEPGGPLFYPGYLSRLGAIGRDAMAADRPLELAGDYTLWPSVEGAVVSGLTAAARLERRFG
jgi:protoporphyrinogen/coproporphyrinogen III oxidase